MKNVRQVGEKGAFYLVTIAESAEILGIILRWMET
jgi:hypothetical protein